MIHSTTPAPAVCYKHPNRESLLRCNQCERNICPDCAVLTPIGYRCKECIRGQQKIFNTAETVDYPIAFFVAAFLSLIGSLIAGMLGLWGIFLAPIAGGVTAEAVRWAIRRHRAPNLYWTAAAGAVCRSPEWIASMIARVIGNFIRLPMPYDPPLQPVFTSQTFTLWRRIFSASSPAYFIGCQTRNGPPKQGEKVACGSVTPISVPATFAV